MAEDAFPLLPGEPEFEEALVERGRLLFAGPVDFVKGVVALEGLPAPDRAEVALAGRSNVGKSSLINAITGRKAIARTSVTPGRTQELNFFDVGRRLYLVDMPGYGFAKAPKPDVDRWQRLIRDYLKGRVPLRLLLLLIDARHGIKPSDTQLMDMLDDAAVHYRLVLTKADKVKASHLADTAARVAKATAKRAAAAPGVIVTSSETGQGIAALRAQIAGFASDIASG